jgi:hypothetical protein
VELNYKLSEDESVCVQLGRHPIAIRFQIALACFNVLIFLLILFVPTIHNKGLAWLLFLGGIYLFCDRYLLVPYRLRRLFRRSPDG